MKYGKIINGDLIIKKGDKNDYSQVEEITGSLCIYSNAKLEANNLQTVGGDLDINSNAKLDNLQTVGGSLYINSNAKLEANENIKYDVKEARKIALDFTFNCFINLGFLWADYILAKIISKKKNVYKVQIVGKTELSYCIEVDGIYSHGETLRQAKESLIYKISNRDTSQYEDYTLDTVVTYEEAIKMYRTITGACEQGTKHFCESILKDKKDKYTVKECIELTKGQYGNETFKKFFEVNNDR